MSKVVLEGYIVVPESDLETVTSKLVRHIKLRTGEAGGITFVVNQDRDDSCRFNVYEDSSPWCNPPIIRHSVCVSFESRSMF